jgi:OPA family glycerol-3-phosphate transporter-like MFS transporter
LPDNPGERIKEQDVSDSATAHAPVPVHSPEYRQRRFMNWFPLGLTYATFYMGRYNFNVVKGDLGRMFELDKAQMGIIATAGFWTYALAVMINGPLADRFGGRKAILFGAAGAALLNLLIGMMFLGGLQGQGTKLIVAMSLLYSVNMYFQSFGALSVVKVNSSWFHVTERGVFGGIFGSMISAGYFLAITVGGWILSFLTYYWIFLIPAMAIATMFTVDFLLVRDKPSQAGHKDFDTGDATTGPLDPTLVPAEEPPVSLAYIARKVFTNPIVLTIAAAEFCTGFVRQGLLLYFTEYLHEVHHITKSMPLYWWVGLGITIGGILGGIVCGWMSDKLFQSRRPPVAFIFYWGQVLALLLLAYAPGPYTAAFLVGFSCMWIFGVHGMLSGTASMDFGGRKAAASATGFLDGIQYVASGLTGFGLGWILKTYGWDGTPFVEGYQPLNATVWAFSIIPFSIIGSLLMLRIWNARPSRGGGH